MKEKTILQIQPQFSQREQWAQLADREGLYYEPLELSSLPAIGDDTLFADCREWYRSSGRVCSLHGMFIDVNPASGDPLFRRLSRERCHESCRLAAELGAGRVVFHSSAFPFLRGGYLDGWAESCAEFYTELAETYGIELCIENSQDIDPMPLKVLFGRISRSDIGVCLDIGHTHYSHAPLEEWFDLLGENIRYLHLSDNMGSFDDHLPLGKGSVDWALADRLWRSLDRMMPITLEVGGTDGVEHSLDYLRRNGYFGMEG